MHFLSIGECMAELAPTETPGQFRLGYAGDTFNTAWYLRKLGADVSVSYFTAVGTDALSTQMLDAMSDAGIDTGYIARIPKPTVGLYMISLTDGERSFTYWRENSAARRLADDRIALTRALADADLIYFSGITLAILDETGRATLLDVLKEVRAQGKTIAFDPNLRPRLWSSTEQMTRTIMQGAQVSDIVLPSFEDEASFFGDRDPAATATRYANAGAETVVVKNGPGAVHFLHGGQEGEITIPAVAAVVDTTAAGDSFNAGFLAGLDRGRPLPDMIKAASRVAAQVIGGKGALVPIDLADTDF